MKVKINIKMTVCFLILFFIEISAQNLLKPIWTPATRLYDDIVYDAIFDSTGKMYIAADMVYVSNDSGKTADILSYKRVSKLFLSPHVFLYAADNGGLYRYKPNDSTMEKLFDGYVRKIAFGLDEQIIVLGALKGLFYSTDKGANWNRVINNTIDSTGINALSINSEGEFYAGGFINNGSTILPKFYHSLDGISWEEISVPDTFYNVNNIIFTRTNKIVIGTINGMYESNDIGSTWEKIGSFNSVWKLIATDDDKLYTISDGELWRSVDYGNEWQKLNLENSDMRSISVNESGEIFVATYLGLYSSSDEGKTWDKTLIVNTVIPALCIALDRHGNLVIGTENGVYTSNDDGNSWFTLGLQGCWVKELFVSPTGYLFSVVRDSGLYVSANTGQNWYKPKKNPILPIKGTFVIDSSGNIYYSAFNDSIFSGEIFKSSNNAASWIRVFSSPLIGIRMMYVSKKQNLYALADSVGIFRSVDGGESWDATYPSMPAVGDLVGNDNYLFASFYGVYRTKEDRLDWKATGLEGHPIGELEVDEKNNIYAFDNYNKKIYCSTNNGDTWNVLIDSVFSPVTFLEINSDQLFVLTQDGSILRGDIVTSVLEPGNEINQQFSLSQNYPNPFNPSTIIGYQLPAGSHVILKIYDILGREAATLVNKEQSPGNYHVTWNASGFSSGVYYYRITAGAFSQTKKLLLLK